MTSTPPKKTRLGTLVAAALLAGFAILAIFYPRTLQYPYFKIEVQGMTITMLMKGQATGEPCERMLRNIATAFLAACPQCRANARQCLSTLSPEQHALLSEKPLEMYSARLPNGITTYESTDRNLASITCVESERQSAKSMVPVQCHAPGTLRPMAQGNPNIGQVLATGLGQLAIAFLASWFVCWLIIRFEHLHAHLSHDHTDGGPQKFHATPTPRVGGLALMTGLLAAAGVIVLFEATLSPLYRFSPYDYALLLIAGMPAFLGGLTEDVTKKVGVLDRLLLTMTSGMLAAWLLGAVLNRMDIPGIDFALAWIPFAIIFTAFAVGGVANAVNIIDGYNGLAAGYSGIVLIAYAWVSAQTQDTLLLHTSLALLGTLMGFLAWNWPKGKLFLGDGGAYLLGFLLAEISVLLVVRNPNVSPWFPVLLLAHPIFETTFSIYRRQFARGHSPGRPDDLHLHQLIYRRVVRVDNSHEFNAKLRRNNRVAPFYWGVAVVLGVLGISFYDNTVALAMGTVMYCIGYIWLYRLIESPRT